ncbi:hypothetical protein SeLEV6574_g01932 [Synchytrium endobioticum]|uniref:Leucine carboxyl methyltransferase 1 n=1 Tax=Synchytrium endobioticum TaxID=286115 RepID=A0A507DAN6_9FUNG|nr:hypothetical protein SeLEV6574_g01932 [Synchytrium endobioticum]
MPCRHAYLMNSSAVSMGYIHDDFVASFVRKPQRRAPIINRGSYVRSTALATLISLFLQLPIGHDKQIVSLGAGSDTRYFLLRKEGLQPKRYFEIDFMEVTSKKALAIKQSKDMSELLGPYQLASGGTDLYSDQYCILAGDLRNWETAIVPKLLAHGLDITLPTLFISECVLIYMPPEDADRIVSWIPQHIHNAFFITYEQILPNDTFGKTMIENLKMRKIELPGIYAYPTLESQKQRYLSDGWDIADSIDVNHIYDSCIPPSEQHRISRLEIFDELEEWKLLSAHYCVSWAVKSSSPDYLPVLANQFGLKAAENSCSVKGGSPKCK